MEAERVEIAAERQAIIAQTEADAKRIEETARQLKHDEFEEEKERLRKEQEERMAEIAYLKQEAEAERINAKDEYHQTGPLKAQSGRRKRQDPHGKSV